MPTAVSALFIGGLVFAPDLTNQLLSAAMDHYVAEVVNRLHEALDKLSPTPAGSSAAP